MMVCVSLMYCFLVLTIMLNLRYINSGLFNTENGVFFHFFCTEMRMLKFERVDGASN